MYTAREIIEQRKKLWEKHKSLEKDRQFRSSTAEYMMENKNLVDEVIKNPELIIEMFFVIVDKQMQTVPFFLNEEQKKLIGHIAQAIEDYKNGKRLHLKFLILKGRQFGATTVITAYQLANALTKKNFSGITLADEQDNTNTIFEKKAKYPYNNLPESIKPTTKYNNRREFLFSKLNSSWYVATAGNDDVGRSNTLNFFHGSEAAFWKSISAIITGLGEALTKDSIQVLESTANGFNEFKDLWDGSPDNTWEALFFYWWNTTEYRMPYESDKHKKKFEKNVTEELGDNGEEIKLYHKLNHLRKTYNLEWSQLYWYYNKWKGYIDKDKILQEYPCNPREAFLASGRCVFDTEVVSDRIDVLEQKYKKEPPKRGFFRFKWHNEEYQDYIMDDTIEWVDDPLGIVWLYEQPKEGYPYAVGGDTKGEGKDFYAGACCDNTDGHRVAYIHGQFYHSKPFTHQMYCLGKFYNYALIGIEMNFNTGPIEELDRLKYHRQYQREKQDTIAKKLEPRLGWKTDGTTRPYMIDRFVELLNEHPEQIPHILTLKEALTFVYDENNRPDAEEGKHDDQLFADMVLEQIRKQQTTKIEVKPKSLEGKFFTETELKDMGYKPSEIRRILENQTSYKR